MEVFDDALYDYLNGEPEEEDPVDKADRLHDEENENEYKPMDLFKVLGECLNPKNT